MTHITHIHPQSFWPKMQESETWLLWLCTAPDGKQGASSTAGTRGVYKGTARGYVSWNSAAQAIPLVSRLAERFGIEWGEWPGNRILALASVKAAVEYDDLLLLDERERAQVNLYRDVASSATDTMFVFSILQVWPLRAPVEVHQWVCMSSRSFFTDLDQCTFEAVCGEWLADPPTPAICRSSLPTEAIRLPQPFAVFSALGRWTSFVVCELSGRDGRGGWRIGRTCRDRDGRKIPRFRGAAFTGSRRRALDHNKVNQDLDFNSPDIAEQFADVIREVVVPVVDQLDDSLLARLHDYMTAFTCHASEMRGTLMMQSKCVDTGRNRSYDIYYLIRCFLLCDSLRSPHLLKRALYDASSLLLPKGAAKAVQYALDNDELRLPASSTISRLRGRVDVAWMMVWRERIAKWLQDGLVIFPGTDSSPQGGRDYQVLVLDIACRANLPEIHVISERLHTRFLLLNQIVYVCGVGWGEVGWGGVGGSMRRSRVPSERSH